MWKPWEVRPGWDSPSDLSGPVIVLRGTAEAQWQEVTGDMTQLESQGSSWYSVLHFLYPFHRWACRVLGISIWGRILRYTGATCRDVPQLNVIGVGDWPCSQGASGTWGGTSFLVECHIWPQCCFHHGPWAFVFFFFFKHYRTVEGAGDTLY